MERVTWSDQAMTDLERVVEDRAVREQLRRSAEEILQHSPTGARSADEGFEGEVMWRRGIAYEQELKANAELPLETREGPQVWDYFLLYKEREPGRGFEILAVRSTHQLASRWIRMVREPARAREPLTDQAARMTAATAPEVELGGVTRSRARPVDHDLATDPKTHQESRRVAVAEPAESLKKGTRVTSVSRSKLAVTLARRYDSGESIRSLAASTGRSYGFVHRILTETGVILRGRGGATRYGKNKVRR